MDEEIAQNEQDIDSNSYILPQDEIYNVATDKNTIDWKHLLENIIYKNEMDLFDIDI